MASRLIWVEGHYGSTSCSECGADCENHYKSCPECKAVFNEEDELFGFGGSDF